jgi:membrane protein DedA with SNARE-associated domain
MDQIATQLIGFASDHPQWIAVLVFVLSFFEFVPFIWVVLVGVAALVGPHDVSRLAIVVAASTIGGALGDICLYSLGQKNADRLGRIWPFRQHPNLIARCEIFCARWGIGAVIIGRFSGPVRAGVPLVAGALRMPVVTFALASVAAAFVVSVVFLIPAAVGGGTLFGLFGLG